MLELITPRPHKMACVEQRLEERWQHVDQNQNKLHNVGVWGNCLKPLRKLVKQNFGQSISQKNLAAQIVFVVNLHTVQKQSDVTHIHDVKAESAILFKT